MESLNIVRQALMKHQTQTLASESGSSSSSNWGVSEDLIDRLDRTSQLLKYYDVTATALAEQQGNLLSLVKCLNQHSFIIVLT
jgi:hypothetical protein